MVLSLLWTLVVNHTPLTGAGLSSPSFLHLSARARCLHGQIWIVFCQKQAFVSENKPHPWDANMRFAAIPFPIIQAIEGKQQLRDCSLKENQRAFASHDTDFDCGSFFLLDPPHPGSVDSSSHNVSVFQVQSTELLGGSWSILDSKKEHQSCPLCSPPGGSTRPVGMKATPAWALQMSRI